MPIVLAAEVDVEDAAEITKGSATMATRAVPKGTLGAATGESLQPTIGPVADGKFLGRVTLEIWDTPSQTGVVNCRIMNLAGHDNRPLIAHAIVGLNRLGPSS